VHGGRPTPSDAGPVLPGGSPGSRRGVSGTSPGERWKARRVVARVRHHWARWSAQSGNCRRPACTAQRVLEDTPWLAGGRDTRRRRMGMPRQATTPTWANRTARRGGRPPRPGLPAQGRTRSPAAAPGAERTGREVAAFLMQRTSRPGGRAGFGRSPGASCARRRTPATAPLGAPCTTPHRLRAALPALAHASSAR